MTALTIAECAAKWTEAEVSQSHSEACRWDCAPTALASSGTARAQQMADALRVNVTTVHNLAKAQRMFEYIYDWDPMCAISLRDKHSYIRFEAMWRKNEKYEISPYDCHYFIYSDLSNDAMEALIESIHNPDPEWKRRLFGNKQGRSWLAKIATEPDADQPAKITMAAGVLNRWIEEAG